MAVKCSVCGDTFAERGFGNHNTHIHDGEAEPVSTDDGDDSGGEVEAGDGAEESPGAEDTRPDRPDGDDDGDDDADPGSDLPDAPEDEDADHEEPFEDEDSEVEGDPDAGPLSEEVEDTEEDARDYQCGNCGEPLEYLGGEDRDGGGRQCPECGERLFWSKI